MLEFKIGIHPEEGSLFHQIKQTDPDRATQIDELARNLYEAVSPRKSILPPPPQGSTSTSENQI